jgi:hypothetical protein
VFSPYAIAHDMTDVVVGVLLLFAIPLPALVVLTGWLKTFLYIIPIWAVAMMFLDSGYDILMYIVLLFPYAIWLGRIVINRKNLNKNET